MSYFNFKLFNRPVKNVNTDLAFKKGNWAPGYPVKGGRAPILGYRKNLVSKTKCFLPTYTDKNFDLPGYVYDTTFFEYSDVSIDLQEPIFVTSATSTLKAGTSATSSAYVSFYDGTTWLAHIHSHPVNFGEVTETLTFTKAVKITRIRLSSWWNRASLSNLTFSGGIIQDKCCSPCRANTVIYKDNWAKSCARNGEACYNPVIKRIQNNNRKPAKPYYYNTRNLLRSRFSTYEQNAYNFDLSGNLTAWGGGADPANNSYLIHDCSCNAPFTSNNPCIATYKPLNRQFAVNTAVSGRSRIARLKNATKRAAATKTIPLGLLGHPKNSCEFCKRDFKPSKGRKGGDNKSRINSR